MFFEIMEIIVNIAEPLLLFYLLSHKLKTKKKLLPLAMLGILLLAAATTIMNKLGIDFVAVIVINLALYCAFALLFFSDDVRMRLVWATTMIYIMVFANTFLSALLYTISGSTLLITLLQPSTLRAVIQVTYIFICLLMVIAVLNATKKLVMVSSKAAVGSLLSCVICIIAMYLLLEVTIASASVGISSIKFGIISVLLMALIMLLIILFGKASVWAQKYSDERIVTEALKREIQYNSEVTAVSQTVRQLKHDYANHMSVIASMAADGDMEGLRNYMTDYKAEYGAVERYAIMGDNTIDSLLAYKKMICDAEGIEFDITAIGDSMQHTGLSEIEISSLFGNLIDNAINACRKLDPEKRRIKLSIRKMSDMMDIRIENDRVAIEEEKKDDESRGLGLPRIKSIVEAHDGVCTIKPEADRFIVEILLSSVSSEVAQNEA